MVVFASICPHPPILLPGVGSEQDKSKVRKTIESLRILQNEFEKTNPEAIVISSPHPDWGFDVPLYFLAKNFKGKIKTYLTGEESPQFYFDQGKKLFKELDLLRYALIASGDLSHCLREDGPYGFHPDGPKFDKALIEHLNKKDINNVLKLNEMFPGADECGLRSFCFLLGILEGANLDWQGEVLSYEAPFGVGYLVVNFKLRKK
jgi:aromatic ring-opening dioxygenase LigB subunit